MAKKVKKVEKIITKTIDEHTNELLQLLDVHLAEEKAWAEAEQIKYEANLVSKSTF